MISAAQLLLSIFVSDLLPVFAIAGVGFVLARYAGVQVQTVSRLTFHALAPALVFNILATSTADSGQVGRMTLFYALVALSAAIMARLAAIPLRLDRRALTAFLLVVICSNSGNYGLPVTLLAFGREALDLRERLLRLELDVHLHGRGLSGCERQAKRARRARWCRDHTGRVRRSGGSRDDEPRDSAACGRDVADHASQRRGGTDDDPRARNATRTRVVARAARVSWRRRSWCHSCSRPSWRSGIAHLVGLQGAAFQAGVLQTSMPTAVITTILAVEFDVLPDFVTSVVFVSTLLSPLTVTLMIAYLQTV